MQNRILLLVAFACLSITFKASAQHYVRERPSYTEKERPHQPSSVHVWVGDNWVFNKRKRVYQHQVGYWQKPTRANRGRNYTSGHWENNDRGNFWVSGGWH